MPFNRPSLTSLNDEIQADVDASLTDTDPRLRRSFLRVIGAVVAGVAHGLYGYLAWIFSQIFPDSAEGEHLARWARIWGIERIEATSATGAITMTGTVGSVVPRGATWRAGSGAEYRTDAETMLAASEQALAVTAVEAGSAANASAGVKVSLTVPVAGVVSDAVVAAGGIAGGANDEADEDLLARLLARLREPPRGGTENDYEKWAREAHPDVTRAWASPLEDGLGTVTVRFMTYGATDNGIPAGAVVTAVREYIAARSPVTAEVTVAVPAPVELGITIRSVMPDTQEVRAEITAEIADLIMREAAPGGTILVSHIREAISTAAGERDHVLVAPVANVDTRTGEITVLGDITWQTS